MSRAAVSSKGDRTRDRILDAAATVASIGGVSAVTIGPLAESLGMSKSGLFAHFRSKEALQVETLDRSAEHFIEAVIEPVRAEPDKSKRLEIFFKLWLDWIENPGRLGGGCPILSAGIEYDDVPGPVRDASARHTGALNDSIRRMVRNARPGCDVETIAALVDGLALSHLVRVRLLREPNARSVTERAFALLLENSRKD
jgi:AcrR family transcriptional regulator